MREGRKPLVAHLRARVQAEDAQRARVRGERAQGGVIHGVITCSEIENLEAMTRGAKALDGGAPSETAKAEVKHAQAAATIRDCVEAARHGWSIQLGEAEGGDPMRCKRHERTEREGSRTKLVGMRAEIETRGDDLAEALAAGDRALIISNHRTRIDWMFHWCRAAAGC